jgi:sodium/proline symporter
VWIGRAAVVAVAVVAYALALQGGTVLDIVAYAWAGFGAAFGPIIILSLYWSRMSWIGALAGMLVGAGTVVTWEALDSPGGVYSLLPGFAAGLLAAWIGGSVGRRPERVWIGAYRDDTPEELEPAVQ